MKTNYSLAFIVLLSVTSVYSSDNTKLSTLEQEAFEHERKLIDTEQAKESYKDKKVFDAEHKLRSLAKAHHNNQLAIKCSNDGVIKKIFFPYEGDMDIYYPRNGRYSCTPQEVIMLLYTLRIQNRLQEPTKSFLAASRYSDVRAKVSYRGNDIIVETID